MKYSGVFLKIKSSYLLLLLSGLSFIFFSCTYSDIDEPALFSGSAYEPLIMERSNLEKSITYMADKPLESAGKIYSYGKYILINEKYEGVHIYDNSDQRNPVKTGFIKIPGCIDMAVKDGVLYADNAVDLVAIDFNNLPEISVEKRVRGVFPELAAPDIGSVPYQYTEENRPENTVIVKWILK